MTSLVPTAESNHSSWRAHLSTPLAGGALFWLIALIAVQWAPLSSDTYWQLWIARQINSGAPLYDWINETNPPLWFWMAQPIAHLATLTGLPPTHVMVTAIMVEIALALTLCSAFLRDLPINQQCYLLWGMLFCMVAPHFIEFGQRDHMALIAVAPYVLLIARRVAGDNVSAGLSLAIGAFAALMIALKPHVAVVPILLELWLIARRRSFRPLRPETLALACGAVIYVAAIMVVTPTYVTKIMPAVAAAYGEFGGSKLRVVLQRSVFLLPVAGYYFWLIRSDITVRTQAFIVAALGFTVSMLVQFKGFLYHTDPIASAVLMAVLFSQLEIKASPRLKHPILVSIMVIFALSPIALNDRSAQRLLEPTLSDLPSGTKLATIVIDPVLTWPMIEQRGFINISRYYHHWMLNAVANRYKEADELRPRLAALADTIRDEFADDMLCNPADVIVIVPGTVKPGVSAFEFFSQHPRLAPLLTAFAPTQTTDHIIRYDRIAPAPPRPEGMACIDIAP